MAKQIEYEVVKHFGTLSQDQNGYTKEVTLMSWNGAEPKIDIRNWRKDMQSPLKGITLTYEEVAALADMMEEILKG